MRGGKVPNKLTKKQKEQAEKENLRVTDYSKNIYGQPLSEPILGNYYKLPRREVHRHDFQLDTSCAYVILHITNMNEMQKVNHLKSDNVTV